MNILYLCLSYSGMKYDTLLSLGKDYHKRNLISFGFHFLTSLAFIEVYVLAIATCVICFTGKISRVNTSVVM